jgi:uncharacterized Ntn-hydrolase superfamily protein
MTFTLAARCPETGQFGIVISSSSPAVAARCAHTRARVGAVASQNVTDPALGPRLLDLLEGGLGAGAALAKITAGTPDIGWRQLLVVDRNGDCALFTGDRALGVPGEARADGVVAGGNLLADPGVPAAMVAAYLAARGPFGDRLLAGLTGGLAAGGEAGIDRHRLRSPQVAGVDDVPRVLPTWPGPLRFSDVPGQLRVHVSAEPLPGLLHHLAEHLLIHRRGLR